MKRIPLTLFFAMLMSYSGFSQDLDSSGLRFKSVSLGIGITGGSETSGGVAVSADVTMNLNKNLFSLALTSGAEYNVIGSADRNFFAADLLYGREFSISKGIKIETHAGVGLFTEKYNNGDTDFQDVSDSTIGLPIRIKLLFYVSDKFAIGLNPNANFNSIDTMYSGNLIFQYNFWK